MVMGILMYMDFNLCSPFYFLLVSLYRLLSIFNCTNHLNTVMLLKLYFMNFLSFCSDDYGKTFQEITSAIKNTYIRSEFGMGLGPENSGRVSLKLLSVASWLLN